MYFTQMKSSVCLEEDGMYAQKKIAGKNSGDSALMVGNVREISS